MHTYKLFFHLSVISATFSVRGQGSFQNLDFEAANLSPVPAGQFGGAVSSTQGIPGWTAFLGTNQLTQILQNNYTLGNASVDILGPNWSFGGIIEGQYTLVLQPGANPFGSGNISASISQTGTVPGNAESIQFKASTFSSFSISFRGQDLPLSIIGTGVNYSLYRADISPYRGQTGALTLTALAGPNTTDYFDSIVFSIPEPDMLSLFALGGLVIGLRGWRNSSR